MSINIGDLVAYNRSGYLEKGVLEKVVPRRAGSRGWNPVTYHIRNSKDSLVSKVKDARCIMLLATPVTTNQIGQSIWRSVI